MILYIAIFAFTTILSLWASYRVKSKFREFSKVRATSGLSGAQAAQRILSAAGINDVQVVPTQGELSDHYDPMNKRLVLCEENYFGQSVAALGVAAHEAGHALQHQAHYKPLHLRMAAVGVTRIASGMVGWLPFLGAMSGLIHMKTALVIICIGWGIIMLFNLITLPVEFDATARAKKLLTGSGMIAPGPETEGMHKVLNAAAWTYVAAFLTSLLYLLYFLFRLLGNRE
ncbi:MAG: zinc metallopeptidase [Verrucomicrobiales bacterium]